MVGRSCYLCASKQLVNGDSNSQHRFPRDAATRKLWMQACDLSELTDEVKNLRICSAHFLPEDYVSNTKGNRLRRKAVPSVKIPGVVLKSEIAVADYEFVDLSCGLNDAVASTESNSVSSPMSLDVAEDQPVVIETESKSSNDEESAVSSSDECSSSSEKSFKQPRYVSRISLDDMETPKSAKGVISFIKKQARKQSMKIKHLQQENRRLRKELLTLRRLVRDLRGNKDS